MRDNPNARHTMGFFNCGECGNPFHRAIGAERHDSLLSNIIMEIDRNGFRKRSPLAYFQCESCLALSAIVYEDHSGCISVSCMTVVGNKNGLEFRVLCDIREHLASELGRLVEVRA